MTTFSYFAYASNLLTQRIHISNPSAVRVGIGKLENYRLDFMTYSQRWKGASATIVPHKDSYVWGAIWEIEKKHLETLDEQEGVSDNIYFPLQVNVRLPNGEFKNCRVYQQCTRNLIPTESFPVEKPSAVYWNVILKGARESGLPEDYQEFLKSVPNNGYNGEIDIKLDLKY